MRRIDGVFVRGRRVLLHDALRAIGINDNAYRCRLAAGWSRHEALTTPKGQRRCLDPWAASGPAPALVEPPTIEDVEWLP